MKIDVVIILFLLLHYSVLSFKTKTVDIGVFGVFLLRAIAVGIYFLKFLSHLWF